MWKWKRRRKPERLPWRCPQNYKGELTEAEKRRLDAFRMQPKHTSAQLDDLPEEVRDYAETLRRKIAEIPFWYHRIELPGGITTPGEAPLLEKAYHVPPDLTGKRVLDVGAWDGYWTFEALKRGAREVVAIDDFSDYLGHLEKDERKGWRSFDLCREVLGFSESRCKRIEISIYDITEENLGGRFDIVFFFGTLYHLRHPLLGLDKVASVCDGQIIVESQVCDDFSPYSGGFDTSYPGREMVAEFFPTDELAGNVTNWWAPSICCLGGLIYAAGFTRDIQLWKLIDNPKEIGFCRGFASGFKPNA
jgi:tRNA (mo5U34)-methyltransferase